MLSNLNIFMNFFKRDWHVMRQRALYFIRNYSLAYPLSYSLCFGYVMPNVFFGPHSASTTVVFVGNILIPIILVTHAAATELLFDFDGDRYVAYQTTLISPRLVFLQRILSAALLAFILVLPFFPISKLLLGSSFDTSNASIPAAVLMLFFSSLCISAYQFLIVCALKDSSELKNFWIRYNQILTTLGGFFIPHAIVTQFSPLLGKIALVNPYLYVTEGLRHAIIRSDMYITVPVCISMLSALTGLFVGIGFYYFKRKLDHI